jgi:transcriptional regulator with XRE-family HTH domain
MQSVPVHIRGVTGADLLPPLRAVRVAQGLSLRDTAQRAGLDPTHLSRVERGTKNLSLDALYRLAAALELEELQRLLTPYVTPKRPTA